MAAIDFFVNLRRKCRSGTRRIGQYAFVLINKNRPIYLVTGKQLSIIKTKSKKKNKKSLLI